MEYLITFLEGVISFISPCMLPMLPVYISYFAGNTNKRQKTFLSAVCFVLGFTLVFCILGTFAGSIGALFSKYHTVVEVMCGIIIVLLGLDFLNIINIPFFKSVHIEGKGGGAFSAFLFGMVFSIAHAPCMIAFLGTALVTASASASAAKGVLLLLAYSLGMGIPVIVSALLIKKLNTAFDVIKRNYKKVNIICGSFLIAIGILMMSGLLHKLLHLIAE